MIDQTVLGLYEEVTRLVSVTTAGITKSSCRDGGRFVVARS